MKNNDSRVIKTAFLIIIIIVIFLISVLVQSDKRLKKRGKRKSLKQKEAESYMKSSVRQMTPKEKIRGADVEVITNSEIGYILKPCK